MSNLCQPCGRSHVDPEQFRTIWMESTAGLYIEWDKNCENGCGDKPSITLTNGVTGETREFSPNEVWVLFGGDPEAVGLMTDSG